MIEPYNLETNSSVNLMLGDIMEKVFFFIIISTTILIFLGYKTDDSIGWKASDFSCNLLPKRKKDIKEIVKYI